MNIKIFLPLAVLLANSASAQVFGLPGARISPVVVPMILPGPTTPLTPRIDLPAPLMTPAAPVRLPGAPILILEKVLPGSALIPAVRAQFSAPAQSEDRAPSNDKMRERLNELFDGSARPSRRISFPERDLELEIGAP